MPIAGPVWDWITGAIGYFFGALKLAIAGIVGRVLGTFGLSLVTFNGILPNLKAFFADYVNSLPPALLQLAGAVGLDVAMSMIVSALTVRMTWSVFVIPTSVKQQLEAAT